jgi:hypothetical protein
MSYINENQLDLRNVEMINIVKVLGGIERHYRNVKTGQIEVVFVARPCMKVA